MVYIRAQRKLMASEVEEPQLVMGESSMDVERVLMD